MKFARATFLLSICFSAAVLLVPHWKFYMAFLTGRNFRLETGYAS